MNHNKELEDLENKFDHLFFDIVNISPFSVVITDEYHRIEYVSPYFTEITGYNFEELIGRNPSILKSGLTSKHVYQDFYDSLAKKGTWNGEFINQKKNGDIYIESANIYTLFDKFDNKHYVDIKKDVTEHTRLLENVYIDSVTSLFNRRYIDEKLPKEVDEAILNSKELSLIFMDLDYFKNINDQFGHSAGDKIIAEVASLLKRYLRKSKGWVARYGGDEFVICLPNKSKLEGSKIAQEISVAIETHSFTYKNMDVHVASSIGVGAIDEENGIKTASDLLRIADQRLYSAKSSRK